MKEPELFSDHQPQRPPSDTTESSTKEEKRRRASLSTQEKGGKKGPNKLPCRISIKVSGVEAFLYNHSPAYDLIVQSFAKKETDPPGSQGSDGHPKQEDILYGLSPQASTEAVGTVHPSITAVTSAGSDPTDDDREPAEKQPHLRHHRQKEIRKPEPPPFLRLLPIRVDVNRGAIAIGNENTTSIVSAKFAGASGEFDVAPAGDLDIYKQLFKFEVRSPVVTMKPNVDYKTPQLATAARLKANVDTYGNDTHGSKARKGGIWHSLRTMPPMCKKSVDSITTAGSRDGSTKPKLHTHQAQPTYPGQEKWQGLSRYLENDSSNGHGEWDAVEYAKQVELVNVSLVNLTFYWDMPGPVPRSLPVNMQSMRDINGSSPPEYGIDLAVGGGVVRYGPWADRHRTVLQNYFFPPSHTDASPAKRLYPGETRICTVFKLFLSLDEEVVLRLPMREPSKDWKWKGKAAAADPGKREANTKGKRRGRNKKGEKGQAPNARPFAWIDVKIAKDTTVSYEMDMVANKHGFRSLLDVDVRGTEIETSVNHGLFWRTGTVSVSADLSVPLRWNGLRSWPFKIEGHDFDIFILRDHLFLIIDLVNDWSAGPPPDFYTFTPFKYTLDLNFYNVKLFLNTNDANIINEPSSLDDNNFIILGGQLIHAEVGIPLDRFRPVQNEVPFSVVAHHLYLEVCMPPKSTLNAFVKERQVAHVNEVTLKGSHVAFTETSPNLTDRLFFDIRGKKVSLYMYGWLTHHLIKIKDNYFGDDLHFKTLEEYQEVPEERGMTAAAKIASHSEEKSNDLDTILCISAEDGAIFLPSNLYSNEENIRLDVSYADVDLRFTNYYMDLQVNSSPLTLSVGSKTTGGGTLGDPNDQTEIFIGSVTVMGHRLFGLPPTEPTYMSCYDVDVGKLSGECSEEFLIRLAGAARAFAFSVGDGENAMPVAHPIVIHDTTFVRLNAEGLHLWAHVGDEALLVSCGAVRMTQDDCAGSTFSQRLTLLVPDLTAAFVDAGTATRKRAHVLDTYTVETHALLHTSISFSMLMRKERFFRERQLQQDHLEESDSRTNRIPFLLLRRSGSIVGRPSNRHLDVAPPALPLPPVPEPLQSSLSDGAMSLNPSTSGGSIDTFASKTRHKRRAPSLRQAPSRGSLANSIRSGGVSLKKTRANSRATGHVVNSQSDAQRLTDRPYDVLPTEQQRVERNLPPSSMALSSSLTEPYFPLALAKPNFAVLPQPSAEKLDDDAEPDATPGLKDLAPEPFDSDRTHTSFIIRVLPGIRAYCAPEAVNTVANLMESIEPKVPEDILDAFQISVLSMILDLLAKREGKIATVDLLVNAPSIDVRFMNTIEEDGQRALAATGQDQYDASVSGLNLSFRNTSPSKQGPDVGTIMLHTTFKNLDISIKEKQLHQGIEDVAVRVRVDEILLWLVKSDSLLVNVSFNALESATSSTKVEFLASLIHRTALIGDTFKQKFDTIVAEQEARLRYFAYQITTLGSNIADPPFLSRASYALRATKDHLRNHDSWKILCRFRYILQNLPDDVRDKVRTNVDRKITQCPGDAEARVLASWDQWRTWDLAHVKRSFAMRKIYGSVAGLEALDKQDDLPIELEIRSGLARFVIDPGPKQSEMFLEIFSVMVSLKPPKEPEGLMLLENADKVRSTIVQIGCGDIGLRLQWEICELVEDVIQLFQTAEIGQAKEAVERLRIQPSNKPDDPEVHEFQVVVSTNTSSIKLDTVSLHTTLMSEKLRLSMIGTDRTSMGEGMSVGGLATVDTGAIEVRSQRRVLLRTRTEVPKLYVSHEAKAVLQQEPDAWRVAGSTQKVTIDVKEDILGIMEAADRVLRHEVAYFARQAQKLQKMQASQKQETPSTVGSEATTPSLSPSLHVALIMDAYTLQVPLLQGLTYRITGSIGRISIHPVLGPNTNLRINYDLHGHRHELRSNKSGEAGSLAAIMVPPVNGRLHVLRYGGRTTIRTLTSIETMEVEADALHGLLNAFGKPEVSQTFRAIQEDANLLKGHAEQIFPSASSPVAVIQEKSSTELVYNVLLTFAGLNVLAAAPGNAERDVTAHLALKLTGFKFKVANMEEESTKPLALPELNAQLQRISVELMLSSQRGPIRRCGNITTSLSLVGTVQHETRRKVKRAYRARSPGIDINMYAETASAVVDVINHLQDRLRELDLSKEKEYLQRIRQPKKLSITSVETDGSDDSEDNQGSSGLFTSAMSLELLKIQISWIVGNSVHLPAGQVPEDLVLSFSKIDLSTRKENAVRLMIEDMQLQIASASQDPAHRSQNSALMPEVVFNVAYAASKTDVKLAFQAAAKSLDIRLDSLFILPAHVIQQSMTIAAEKFRAASATWQMTPTTTGAERKNPFGKKKLSSLLVHASFAGAVVYLSGRNAASRKDSHLGGLRESQAPQQGRYGQFSSEGTSPGATLRAPGVALRVEYKDINQDPALNVELKVDASTNLLYPTIVPLIMDISNGVTEILKSSDDDPKPEPLQTKGPQRLLNEENIITADPSAILGKTKLNLGIRICKQEFSLSCQPIARVTAAAKFEDIYITANSIKSTDHGHFFAISGAFEKLEASVQHVYSRDSTFKFAAESIVLSLLNSKHLSGVSGISAILRVNPTRMAVNARQLQDFLLFREIWIPSEVRAPSRAAATTSVDDTQDYLVQRYQQVAAAAAFPWNASVAVAEMILELDLGQAIGKSSLTIINLWASSKKNSDWEQNLCVGVDRIGVDSTGRMSGLLELAGLKVRTSIKWPSKKKEAKETPLVSASAGFQKLRFKLAFDYQAFAVADIESFDFLMYNIRDDQGGRNDRLVAILDGGNVQAFCTATTAAQSVALYQAIDRLVQENQAAYKQSLKDIERYVRKTSTLAPTPAASSQVLPEKPKDNAAEKTQGIKLHTDVVVTLRSISAGVFPTSLTDNQILIMHAADVQARFAAALETGTLKIHSGLGMTLGQLSVALASVSHKGPKTVSEVSIEEVVKGATTSRGGVILGVPKVVAAMQTWQKSDSTEIEYLFKSKFEGKVDVGWNFSRIAQIKNMWGTHSRTLASRLGKPLPESAVRITTAEDVAKETKAANSASTGSTATPVAPSPPSSLAKPDSLKATSEKQHDQQQKITAEIKVPQSRYTYLPLEPPIIETPQLRDMGEATPPLEWIGLHRERLPHVTHQVIIGGLLEVVREVEGAYGRILGSS